MERQTKVDSGLVSQKIAERIDNGDLVDDPHQRPVINLLDELIDNLAAPRLANKQSALGWLFGRGENLASQSPKGLYLFGGVGRGKTLLMDIFFDLAPVDKKERVHFHAFMRDVHAQVHTWRQQHKGSKVADPIPPLAEKLASQMMLLCFDEFAVTDVADAMILGRLFTGLLERGVTIVATSNVQPDNLYKDGLNRSFFLPFIDLLYERLNVVELASSTDYRLQKMMGSKLYLTGPDAEAKFGRLWKDLTVDLQIKPVTIEVSGRVLEFEKVAGSIARATFKQLCQKPLGSHDYLAMAERFHTLFIANIPELSISDRNAVKRFIALVDTFYDAGHVLIISAAAELHALYPVDYGTEVFEFQRTLSRLTEMQSEEWLKGQ